MRFVDIIEKKRDGFKLSTQEIKFWIEGYVNETIPDYQVSALLMAIYFKGMDSEEIAALTDAMLHSGDIIDLSAITGIKCDKHSTGGVGDKTSLSLAPMVAACGVKVAKMSGRGLGHTGGTLDKVESFTGYEIGLSEADFIAQVNEIGLALIGQTTDVVPADKKLYALRDVSATVDSVPLIASSIMSKKLASGADAILLDVKYGEGAFMKTPEDAEFLAKTMIEIGRSFNKDTRAMISNMNQPLGNAIGNSLEVQEAIATLKDEGPADFKELCFHAGSIMMVQAGVAKNEAEARVMLQGVIDDGSALAKLKQMVVAQHGDGNQVDRPELLPQAKEIVPIIAKQAGYIHELKALQLGTLAMQIGAGRQVKEDQVNLAVGIVLNKKDGDKIQVGDVLAYVHTDQTLDEQWIQQLHECFIVSNEPCEKAPLIYKVLQ